MRSVVSIAALCALAAGQAFGTSIIASEVSAAAKARDFKAADQMLKLYRAQKGVTPDYLEALSWVGRGQLFAKNYKAALDNATTVHELSVQQLKGRKLDADTSLPTALGASIEVTGQSLAGEGKRDEAVLFLKSEMEKWKSTSIAARIQKNVNLLSLEGKPAPPLEITHGVTGPQPRPLTAHRGHPVLLFFWAHWCADCKQEIAIIERIQKEFKAKGLEVIAPTQHYGYVAGGEDAPRDVETRYIAKVYADYYAGLGSVETPIGEGTFVNYGVSTTPTLVLVNSAGVVTLYHPGLMTFEELSAAIRPIARL